METSENIDIYISLLAGSLLLVFLAIMVFVFFLVYRKRLFEQQIHLEKKESEYRLDLLKTTIEATEQERKRIASDLHDEIGSHLSAVRMTFNAIKAKSENMPELSVLVDDGKVIVDQAIASIRAISHNLLPPGLETFGFINTATDLCQKLSVTSSIRIVFKANEKLNRFNTDIELVLYRILQELLTNGLRHACAKNIHIKVDLKDEFIQLVYEDDGIGIDQNKLKEKAGLGIKNIESRAASLHGKVTFNTTNNIGFATTISLPFAI
jgi:two-component system, NarL family, sensor kinase